MANPYDQLAEILSTSTCPDIWALYESFRHQDDDELPSPEKIETRIIADAIVFATDIIRATIIEESMKIQRVLRSQD